MYLPQFPNSRIEPLIPTSPSTPNYNCIAWAYGDDTKWFWPDKYGYWPDDIPREKTVENFILLFNQIGYEVCLDGEFETGYEKVAIYATADNAPQHAARQLENGSWTSKLGQNIDVSHSIFSMSNGFYGNVAVYLKRPIII